MLHACQCCRLTHSPAKGEAYEGLQNEILCAVGEHGGKNKNGEAPSVILAPHLFNSHTERRLLFDTSGCVRLRVVLCFLNTDHGNEAHDEGDYGCA